VAALGKSFGLISFDVQDGNDYAIEAEISEVLSKVDHLVVIGESTEGKEKTVYSEVLRSSQTFHYPAVNKIFVVRLGSESHSNPQLLCIPHKPGSKLSSQQLANCILGELNSELTAQSCPQLDKDAKHSHPRMTQTDPTPRKLTGQQNERFLDMMTEIKADMHTTMLKVDDLKQGQNQIIGGVEQLTTDGKERTERLLEATQDMNDNICKLIIGRKCHVLICLWPLQHINWTH